MSGEAVWIVASNVVALLPAHKAWRRGDPWLAAVLLATGIASAAFHACGDANLKAACAGMTTGTFLRVDSTLSYSSILLVLLRVAVFRFAPPYVPWSHPSSVGAPPTHTPKSILPSPQITQHAARIVVIGALATAFAVADSVAAANLAAGAAVLFFVALAVGMYWWFRVHPDPYHVSYGAGNVVPHHTAVTSALSNFMLGFLANRLAEEPALSDSYRTFHGFWHVGIFLAAWTALDIGVVPSPKQGDAV